MVNAIIVLTSCASLDEAERIAAALLDQRLVACASIGAPVTSRYRWQDKLESAVEVPLALKSGPDCFERIAAEIKRLHSYDIPEILALPVAAASPDYQSWLAANIVCTPLE